MAFQRRELLRVRARKISDEKSVCRERCSKKLEMEPPVRVLLDFPKCFIREAQFLCCTALPSPAGAPGYMQTLHPGQGLGCMNKTVKVR